MAKSMRTRYRDDIKVKVNIATKLVHARESVVFGHNSHNGGG